MFHDRVAFGGTLIAVATLYLWLGSFPLRQGTAWAWWPEAAKDLCRLWREQNGRLRRAA